MHIDPTMTPGTKSGASLLNASEIIVLSPVRQWNFVCAAILVITLNNKRIRSETVGFT